MCAGAGGWDGDRFFVAADGALSVLGTGFGGGCPLCDLPLAIVVGGFINVGCVTVCADFPMAGGVGCPVGKMRVVTGVKLAIRLVADGAHPLCGAGGGATGVSSFIFDGVDAVAVGSGAGVPVVGGVGCPCVIKGVGVGGGGGGDGNSHISIPFDTINSAFSSWVGAITDFDLCAIDIKICPPIGLTH